MFAKIKELKELGYKKYRAAKQLKLDIKTVRKYWDMTDEEYAAYLEETKERTKIMDPYREFILGYLRTHPEITSGIIYDRLREADSSFKPSYRSVRLYVKTLREREGIAAPRKIRQYTEVAELPYGFQAQVDLGQKNIKDPYGRKVKVYIFAMVLSCSRYKFVCFQLEPFTAETFIQAHDRAFRFFGGRPSEIVYDQDRVMVVSENHGDIIFTERFESYKNYAGFSIRLCRGFDPESKGKIEAVVKYVKYNFLPYRTFQGIAALNSQCLSWLDRTANGLVHETTKLIPKLVFAEEQPHLKTVSELSERSVVPKIAIVRKNNVVMYLQNRYSVPKGTYYPGRKARIETDEETGIIRFYDAETGVLLEQHKLCREIGKYVRNDHPERDNRSKHEELKQKVLSGFEDAEKSKIFVDALLAEKPRYTRDQLSMLAKLQSEYSSDELDNALKYCLARNLFTASDFKDTLEYFRNKKDVVITSGVRLPIKYSIVVAETRSISVYTQLAGGGVQ